MKLAEKARIAVLSLGIAAGGYSGIQAVAGAYEGIRDENTINQLKNETSLLYDAKAVISQAEQDLTDYEGNPQPALTKIDVEIAGSQNPNRLAQKLDRVRIELGDITKSTHDRILGLDELKTETDTNIDLLKSQISITNTAEAEQALKVAYGATGFFLLSAIGIAGFFRSRKQTSA